MEKDFKTVSKLLFPDEQALNKTPSQRFEEQLRNRLHSMRQERTRILYSEAVQDIWGEENYQKIADFILFSKG